MRYLSGCRFCGRTAAQRFRSWDSVCSFPGFERMAVVRGKSTKVCMNCARSAAPDRYMVLQVLSTFFSLHSYVFAITHQELLIEAVLLTSPRILPPAHPDSRLLLPRRTRNPMKTKAQAASEPFRPPPDESALWKSSGSS